MSELEDVRADVRALGERITTSVGKVHDRLDDVATRVALLEPECKRIDARGEKMAATIEDLGKADVRVEEQIKALTGAFGTSQVEQERRHSEVIDELRSVRAESATKAGDGEEGIQQWVKKNPAVSMVLMTILFLVSFSVIMDVLKGDTNSAEVVDLVGNLTEKVEKLERGD